jgi:hypothetical protein
VDDRYIQPFPPDLEFLQPSATVHYRRSQGSAEGDTGELR